jgi:hypothetical protein
LIFSEGTPWKKEREVAGNGLLLFRIFAGPKVKNPLASKFASDFMTF